MRGRYPSCRARSASVRWAASAGSGSGSSGRILRERLVRQRLVRAAARGGGTDLGTGGGSSGLDSKRSQRYLDCLGKAKRPADIEKCAAILEE